MIKQTKALLGLFKDGMIDKIIGTVGGTTFYSDTIYDAVEADDIVTLMLDKALPTAIHLKKVFPVKTDEEILTVCTELGIEATLDDLKK